jgi:hypothetical protein
VSHGSLHAVIFKSIRHILFPIHCCSWFGLIVSIKFKDESVKVFLGLFQNQLRAFHAVVVLGHILFDDQASVAFADIVPFVPGALPSALRRFEAGGYEKAF